MAGCGLFSVPGVPRSSLAALPELAVFLQGSPMPSRPIHVSMIGCGAVAETFYAPALQSLERSGRCEVVALVDPSPQRAAQLQRSFPRARTFGGLDQLAGGDEALAIIASPVRFHAEQTLR